MLASRQSSTPSSNESSAAALVTAAWTHLRQWPQSSSGARAPQALQRSTFAPAAPIPCAARWNTELTPRCSAESGPFRDPASFGVYKYGRRTPARQPPPALLEQIEDRVDGSDKLTRQFCLQPAFTLEDLLDQLQVALHRLQQLGASGDHSVDATKESISFCPHGVARGRRIRASEITPPGRDGIGNPRAPRMRSRAPNRLGPRRLSFNASAKHGQDVLPAPKQEVSSCTPA